jgi:hypothetical protein
MECRRWNMAIFFNYLRRFFSCNSQVDQGLIHNRADVPSELKLKTQLDMLDAA